MKKLSKQTSWLMGAVLLLAALTVFSKTSAMVDIHSSVISRAAQSKNGVVMVLTKRGTIAAKAAYLLLAQVEQNSGFAPLFIAVEDGQLAAYMEALALPQESLPAVIFFNKSGIEMVRVVAAKSVMTKIDKSQDHAN